MRRNRTIRKPADYYRSPENSIGYLTRLVFRNFSRVLEKYTLQHEISAGQWRFLRQLWIADGITQRELSERVGMRDVPMPYNDTLERAVIPNAADIVAAARRAVGR